MSHCPGVDLLLRTGRESTVGIGIADVLRVPSPRAVRRGVAHVEAPGLLRPRLLALEEGEGRFNGKTYHGRSVPDYRRQVVYLHQRPALWEGTVEANLRRPFGLQAHQARQFDRSQMIKWLALLDRNASFLEQPQRELSGGETQLVGFLRAIQLDPSILLLDEPTASLDHQTAIAVERLIDHWMAAGTESRAFLWVTHDLGQAERVSNRTLQMKQGELRDD